MTVETLGDAWSYGWRITMRCLHDGREGLKHKRRCDYRVALDLQTLVCTRGSGSSTSVSMNEKRSRYQEAGSPICCFLPSCRKPFLGTCIHANDGHFYCSHACAEEGEKIDLSHVEHLRSRKA